MKPDCIIHNNCLPFDTRYPRTRVNGVGVNVSHVVYAKHNNIPLAELKGKVIMHTCDTPTCVNPTHLVLGTQKDNVQDMWEKGRQGVKGMPGSKHPMSKITEDIVRAIRADARTSGKTLALRYSVSVATISMIRSGKIWKHVI